MGGPGLASALMREGLVDEFRFMINPVALGEGTPIFRGMKGRMSLELVTARKFDSGNVLLCYRPARKS